MGKKMSLRQKQSQFVCLDDYKGVGVYAIIRINSSSWYIGSSINVYRRYKEHRRGLRGGKHPNVHLQRAWNKYGGDNFIFKLLAKTTKENMLRTEQYFMDLFGSYDIGYNMKPMAGNCLGRKLSQKTKEKIRKSHSGKILSYEHKQNISDGLKKTFAHKEYTDEERNNYRVANLGSANPAAKLTEDDVLKIKSMLDDGVYQKNIARIFGVSRGHISSIKRGLRWQHILS